jgi:hypothetical protein
MGSMSPLEITFDRAGDLHVRVDLTGTIHVFSSGKRGYTFRDSFDFSGGRWLLRFQAFETQQKNVTTLGLLSDVLDPKQSVVPGSSDLQTRPRSGPFSLAQLRARREQLKAGWHLARAENRVMGWFEMARVHELPKGKMGSSASFNVELNGVLYLGQFNLSQQPQPIARPTAWDNTKGAKAGLPTLGKWR